MVSDQFQMIKDYTRILKSNLTKSEFRKLLEDTNRCNKCFSECEFWNGENICVGCIDSSLFCLDDIIKNDDYCGCCARSKCSFEGCTNILCPLYSSESQYHTHNDKSYKLKKNKIHEAIEFLRKQIGYNENEQINNVVIATIRRCEQNKELILVDEVKKALDELKVPIERQAIWLDALE
jgi:hypothetical protein